MISSSQPWLPKVDKVRRVRKTRKHPEPRVRSAEKIRKYELLYRPFDLKFRGRVNRWLVRLKELGIDFDGMLRREERKVLELYFFPYKGRWLNQKEVVEIERKIKLRGLRESLVKSLITLWKEARG